MKPSLAGGVIAIVLLIVLVVAYSTLSSSCTGDNRALIDATMIRPAR